MTQFQYFPEDYALAHNPIGAEWLVYTENGTTDLVIEIANTATAPAGWTGTKVLRFSRPGTPTALYQAFRFAEAANNAQVEALMLARRDAAVGMCAMVNIDGGSASTWPTGYGMGFRNNTTDVRGRRWVGTSADPENLGAVAHGYADTFQNWYWVRVQATSTQCRMKHWPHGDSEPETWALTEDVTTWGYQGGAGFGDFFSGISGAYIEMAYYGVGTGGDPAPLHTDSLSETVRHSTELQQPNRGIGPARAAGLEGDLQ